MISIIIPTYNRQIYISETLESLSNQTFKDWECIIVDDGSTDETDSVVKKYTEKDSRFRFFHRPENKLKGANSCRNFGFQKANRKYIKFLDSDDLLTPDCLERQVKILEENNNFQACMSYGRFFNDQTKELEDFWSRNEEYDDYLLGHITNQIWWAVSDPLWRKTFFKKPPFKEGLMNSQEWLMHGKALLKLKRDEIYNLKENFTLIRRGNLRMSSNKSSNYYQNQKKARIYLLNELLEKRNFHFKAIYQLLKQIIVYQYWELKQIFK